MYGTGLNLHTTFTEAQITSQSPPLSSVQEYHGVLAWWRNAREYRRNWLILRIECFRYSYMQPGRVEWHETQLCGRIAKSNSSKERDLLTIHFIHIHLSWSEARVRFPALHFLRSNGSRSGSTQPREYNWEVSWKKKSSGPGLENRDYGLGMSRWPRSTLYPQKLALT
jgi:hypothetical protein